MPVDLNNNVAGTSPTDNTDYGWEFSTPQAKQEYDDLMKQIQDIMSKSSYSAEDAKDLEDALRRLRAMQTSNQLETGLNNDFNVLLIFFKSTGFDPDSPSSHIDPSKLPALSSVSLDLGNGAKINLSQALDLALNPDRHDDATKTLGDRLLDFATWGLGQYNAKLEDLETQIDIATKALNDLKALQDILNLVTPQLPDNYKFPPTSWDDIPAEIQAKLAKMPNIGPIPPTDFSKVSDWIKANIQTYTGWSDDYFKQVIGVTPNIQPDTVYRMLQAKADLETQRQRLIDALTADAAAKGQTFDPNNPPIGSPLDTINQVLATLNRLPPGVTVTATANNDGTTTYTLNPPDQQDATEEAVKEWIMSGQGTTGSTTNDLVDKAIQANQTFSGQASDELKAQNLQLQTIFDILTQLMRTLDKAIQSPTQKINR